MAKKKKRKKLTNRQKILWLLFGVAVTVVFSSVLLSAFDHDPLQELAIAAFAFMTGSFCIYMGVDAYDHNSANRRDVEMAKLKCEDPLGTEGDE